MSTFNFETVPHKDVFVAANPPPPPPVVPTAEEIYAAQMTQLQARITQFFTRTGSGTTCLNLHVGFMTEEDKTALQAALTEKGYTCTVTYHLLCIE